MANRGLTCVEYTPEQRIRMQLPAICPYCKEACVQGDIDAGGMCDDCYFHAHEQGGE